MDQVSEYYGAAEPPWLRNPGNNHLASSFTQPADSIIKTVGRNPMFMSPPIHEYSCAMKSHFRKFGNQSSSTRKSPIFVLDDLSISVWILVKTLPHLRCVAVFTNVSTEIMIRYAQKRILKSDFHITGQLM